MAIRLKSPAEIEKMRRAGQLLWQVLERARTWAIPGITTAQLDARIEAAIREGDGGSGALPILKGYPGQEGRKAARPFPSASCICINEEVVHAVPGPRILRQGDLVTIDVALELDHWCADAAISLIVGDSHDSGGHPAPATSDHDLVGMRQNLVKAASAVLEACLATLGPGKRWSSIQQAAWAEAERHQVVLVREFAGHGIGSTLHEPPTASFDPPAPAATRDASRPSPDSGAAGLDFILRPGMVLTIEPVLIPGLVPPRALDRAEVCERLEDGGGLTAGRVTGLDDGWTVATIDRSPAAHEERTVAITRHGMTVLTS